MVASVNGNLHRVWGQVSENDDDSSGPSQPTSGIEFCENSSSRSTISANSKDLHAKHGVGADGDGEPSCSSGAKKSMEEILAMTGSWSRGSVNHEHGRCKPCRFVCSRQGCANGVDCAFCHLPHTDKSRNRIGMTRRDYCKSLAEKVRGACSGDPELLAEVARKTTAKSAYLGTLMQELEIDGDATGAGGSAVGVVSASSASGSAGFAAAAGRMDSRNGRVRNRGPMKLSL